MPRQPTLGRLHGNFFFLSHSNWNHNSRVLDQTRSEVCLLPHTVSLAHYYSARCSMPAHTRSGLFYFFFLQSHTHIVLSHAHAFKCESGTLVWLWSGKKAASCETMRSGCIWKLIEPPPQKKCGSGDMWSWEGQGERCTEIARKITLYS